MLLDLFAAAQAQDTTPFAVEEQLSRAEGFLTAGDYERAALLLERFYPANKTNSRLYSLLKSAYWGIKEYGKLDKLITEQFSLAPKNRELYLDQLELFLRQGASVPADQAARAYLELAPRDSLSYQNLATRYLTGGYAEEAVDVYVAGRQALGKPNLFSATLAETYRVLRRFREALEEYWKLWEADPANASILPRLTSLINDIPADDGTMEPFFENLLSKKPNALTFQLKGEWELKKGNIDAAVSAYEEADRRGGADGLLLLELARRLAASNPEKVASLAASYEKIYPKSPDLPQILFFLAQAQTELGQFAAARTTYAKILSPLPEDRANAWLKTAELFLNYMAQPESALVCLKNVKSYPHALLRQEAAIQEARALAARGNFEEAKKTFTPIAVWNAPWAEERDFLMAEWDFYFSNFDDAEKKYTALLDAYPRGERVNDALRRLALLKLAGRAKKSPLAAFASALKDLAQFNEQPAQEKIAALEPVSPPMAAEALYNWGIYLAGRRRSAEAARVFENIKTAYPQTTQAPLALEKLGELAELTKEPQRAKSCYVELLENYPEAINAEPVRGKLRRLSERFPLKSP